MGVLTVVFLIYFLLMIALLTGWRKASNQSSAEIQQKEPLISVVIPVRTEEFTIGNLLQGLAQQEYKNFEIIVVNDDSEDETLWAVSRHQLKNLQIIHNKGKGKKAAITAGVRTARGAIVATTDADCMVPPQWLKHIRAQFLDPELEHAGPVFVDVGEEAVRLEVVLPGFLAMIAGKVKGSLQKQGQILLEDRTKR